MRLFGRYSALCALAMLAGAARAQVGDEPVAQLLARVREVLGIAALDALERAIVVEGPARPWGSRAWHSFRFDSRGAFCETIRGTVGGSVVSDGERVWTRHQRAAATEAVLAERDAQLLLAWVRSGFWLSESSPLELTLEEPQGEAPVLGLAFPDGAVRARLELDALTALPRELTIAAGAGTLTATYGDYRHFRGVAVPQRISVREFGGVEGEFGVERVASTTRSWAIPRDAGPPANRVEDAWFDPAAPAEVPLERISTGHALVAVTIDGVAVGSFLFDSGAGATAITPEAAERLRLERIGTGPMAGLGPNTSTTPLYRCDTLNVGPLTLEDVALLEFDMHGTWSFLPDEIAGVIGWDVLARSVCELDPLGEHLRLYPPSFDPDVDFHPLALYGRLPHVAARYEGGREGLFCLDTGAPRVSVLFNEPTVRRLGLLEGRATQPGSMVGAGGLASFETGTLEWIELADQRFERPPALFSTDATGALADPCVQGTIGGLVMAPFALVLDYPRGRIAFVQKE